MQDTGQSRAQPQARSAGRERSRLGRTTIIICALLAIGVTLVVDGRIPLVDGWLLDYSTALRAAVLENRAPDEDVAVVVLDERSLESDVLRTRPRALLGPEFGKLIGALVAAGARVVAFDIIFRYSGNRLERGYDRAFQQALYRHRGHVVLGRGRDERYVPVKPLLGALGNAPGSLGLLDLRADADGIVRDIDVAPRALDGTQALTLAGAALRLAGIDSIPSAVTLARRSHLEALPTYSLVDVLRCSESEQGREALASVFRERLVFVGASLPTEDRLLSSTRLLARPTTPVGPRDDRCGLLPQIASANRFQSVPGVYVHAGAAQAVLSGERLERASGSLVAVLAGAMAWIGAAFGFRLRRLFAVPLVTLLCAVVWCASLLAMQWGVWLPSGAAMMSALAAMMAGYLAYYLLEGRRRQRIQAAFGRYLSPALVSRLAEGEGGLRLGGDLREVTVMFADLSGFTAMSTRVSAEQLVETTNAYLAIIADVIDETGGYVDKFIGDAVMALWGAPADDPQHPIHGIEAALSIAARVAARSASQAPSRRFGVKIALESGQAIVGNVGSKKRFNYTAVGETVNVASRLESLPARYGCSIVIGPNLHAQVRSLVLCRELDRVIVKGSDVPIAVFEPVAPLAAATPEQRALAADYAEALSLYREQRFEDAAALWSRLAPDGPSMRMRGDALDHAASPPIGDWDGAARLVSK